ncbi:MAG: PorV/PorQ family protein [Clostridium sp.]|nr:PorV/PorQ family protein [Bacteroides sp.]MCM1197471.1 PorV/PorQ family protein [Clostridium sp.]
MKKYIGTILALNICLCAQILSAQENIVTEKTVAMPFLSMDSSPVGMSMGGVPAAVRPDAGAHFGNFAAVPFSDREFSAGASYSLWQPSGASSSIVSAGAMWKAGRRTGLTIGLSSGIGKAYETMDMYGISSGTFTPVDIRAGVGASFLAARFLSIGATLNYARSSLAAENSLNTFFADVQAIFRFKTFNVSLAARNLGLPVRDASGTQYNLPMDIEAGAGYCNTFGEHQLSIGAEAGYFFCTGSTGFSAGAGAEYVLMDMVAFRAGYHYSNVCVPSHASAGLGLKFYGVNIDLSYLFASKVMKNTFGIALGYSF